MSSNDFYNRKLSVPKSELSNQHDSEFTDTTESRIERRQEYKINSDVNTDTNIYGFTEKKSHKIDSDDGSERAPVNHFKLRLTLGIIAGFLGVIVGVVSFALWYKDYLLNKITYETKPSDAVITIVNEQGETVALSDVTETTKFQPIKEEPIKNFLLIGIDSRSKSYNSSGTGERSDVICVMSIDKKNGTIKLLSIARDSYALFPGYSNFHKINASMAYGGPDLLVATVESCLRIEIDGYAYVNFSHMAQIIDAVGGVYVNMTAAERDVANQYINEMTGGSDHIYSTGDGTWLSGIQAVGYARVRYVGNGDYERMERQIEVLRSVMDQFMKMSASGKLSALDDVLEAVVTDIDKSEIEKLAFEFLPSIDNLEMQYLQLPIEGCYNCGMYGDEWSMRVNWNAFIPYVQKYFYGYTSDYDEVDIPSHTPDLSECDMDKPLEELVH